MDFGDNDVTIGYSFVANIPFWWRIVIAVEDIDNVYVGERDMWGISVTSSQFFSILEKHTKNTN
jgi:predicted double-glycine peptidase